MWLYFVLPPQNTIYKKTKTNMKTVFKCILLVLGLVLMINGCGVVKRQQERNEFPFGTSMKITCNIEEGTLEQVDSIIIADTLPPINKWLRSVYIDYETSERIMKYLHIRTYENGTESVYVVMGSEEPFKITKRITE